MRLRIPVLAALGAAALLASGGAGRAAIPAAQALTLCHTVLAGVMGGAVPSSEPLAPCQWDMLQTHATTSGSQSVATGRGVTVGVIDSGVDMTHPDIAPNLNVALSCSFIYPSDPTADPQEVASGDCTKKSAVQDLGGHGTHVASIIGAPINGIGIAGVAPQVTLVALKACTVATYCFVPSVAAALRYAGDHRLDVVNLSLFADPYLFYCGNDAQQRAQYKEMVDAAAYAQQRGVVIVAAAGNESNDLQHPTYDLISPDWPPGAATTRLIHNNCRVAPAEIPGVLAVSSTGPWGIADYTNVGMSIVGVAAPGGDFFQTGDITPQSGVLAAASTTDEGIFPVYDTLPFPGLTVIDHGWPYLALTGTSMASPHAAGVAALVRQRHPGWSPGAVIAAVKRSAQQRSCPGPGEPMVYNFDLGEVVPCQGMNGRTSYFGTGLVDAFAAASQ
jgi:lantibiotic leader peptide-processing serine protease